MPVSLAKLKSSHARRKLPHNNGKPHWVTIRPYIALGYRANELRPGSWSVRSTVNGAKDQWIKRIGIADDRGPADGKHGLSYAQAAELAVRLARGGTSDEVASDAPITTKQALVDYEASLKRQGGDSYNARRAANHLSPALLSKPVALLSS